MEPLKKAYDEGLISPLYMNCDETEKMLHSSLLKNVASEEETRNNPAKKRSLLA